MRDLREFYGGFCQLNGDLYPEGWRFVRAEEPDPLIHGGREVWRRCGLGKPGYEGLT